jgi:hypothetical protein
MTTVFVLSILASVYGSNPYNTGNYNGISDGSSTGNGPLTNTGVWVAMIIGVAALLVLLAMFVRIWRRPKRTRQADASDDESTQ